MARRVDRLGFIMLVALRKEFPNVSFEPDSCKFNFFFIENYKPTNRFKQRTHSNNIINVIFVFFFENITNRELNNIFASYRALINCILDFCSTLSIRNWRFVFVCLQGTKKASKFLSAGKHENLFAFCFVGIFEISVMICYTSSS